jgi:hypothetical protein
LAHFRDGEFICFRKHVPILDTKACERSVTQLDADAAVEDARRLLQRRLARSAWPRSAVIIEARLAKRGWPFT